MKIVNYAELPNPMRFVGNSICFFITALTLTVSFNIDAQVNSSLLLNYNKNSSCDINFPEDSGIINVKNHGVAGNGLQDDTQAIQALFDAYAGLNQIFYFPNGVYLISSGLELKGNFGFDNIQGQCTDSTIIRLADGTFTNNQNPLPVLRTKILGSADVFSNEIRNITINVGVNNPGATGLFFMSNNTGTIQDVKIISEDGQGHRGLDMSTALNGPCLVKNVLVQGFDTGILSGGDAVNSIVYENITVINQNVFGIQNVQQVVTFRNVLSQQNNDIPAFVNGNNKNLAQHWFGQMNVINADLQYTGTGSGSHSTLAVGNCYFNNVTSSGYDNAAVVMYGNFTGLPDQIYQGPDFTEWTHTFNNVASEGKFRLFEDSEMFSLGLEVAEIPSVTWDDLDNWLNVLNYASGNGLTDDTEAIQNAINSMKPGGVNYGKTTLYFPNGSQFLITGTIEIGGPVLRLMGLKSKIIGNDGTLKLVDTNEEDAPVVHIERFSSFGAGNTLRFEHNSIRVGVISNMGGLKGITGNGSGDLFIEDCTSWEVRFNNSQQHIWARQL